MMTRRTIVTAGIAGLATTLAGAARPPARRGHAPGFFAAHHLPLGVQLYAIAPDLDADFDGTLAKLPTMGIRTVEMAGFQGRTAAQLRASFDRAGLRCTSAHLQAVTSDHGPGLDGDLDALARDLHAIGISQVVLPTPPLPVAPTSLETFVAAMAAIGPDDWRRTARFLNDKGRALRRRDLAISYHNHNVEFAPGSGGPGRTAMDVLLAETDPALVSFELDAGWAAAAGIDSAALLRAHPHRFTQMHVKDIKATTRTNYAVEQDPVEVGLGRMDWPAILPTAYAAGVRGFYIEQEPPYSRPRLESIAKSAGYLLALKTG